MSFQEDLAGERVESLPLRDAIAIDKHTILRAAIAMMRTHNLGCAVIVDSVCRPTGIFTEQSVIGMLVGDASIDAQPVSAFADPHFFVVKLTDPISDVWDAVVHQAARFVCVTDEEGQLVGLTGQRGLAEYVCDCFANQIAVQRLGSTPWMLEREGA